MSSPEDIGTIMDGAVTIAVTVVACWFVEWLRNGLESRQSKARHEEQLEILRELEREMSRPVEVSEKPTDFTTSEISRNIDKYSRVRLALDDMNESCQQLEDKYSTFKAEKETEIANLHETNQTLQDCLENAQEEIKLSVEAQKESETMHKVNKRLERDLQELQSKHDLSEMELAAVRAQMEIVEKEATISLEALQARYDGVISDLSCAKTKLEATEKALESKTPDQYLVKSLADVQSKYENALDELQKTRSELELTKADYSGLQSLCQSQDKAFNDSNQEKLELQESRKKLEKQFLELNIKVEEMENNACRDTKPKIEDSFKANTAQLQLRLQDVKDENSRLAKENAELREKCTGLAAQKETPQTARRGSNAPRISSPLSAESQRNQQEFEKRLSQNEQKIRDLQNSSLPSSPTNKPLAQQPDSMLSGTASPISPSGEASSRSNPPTNYAELENMDLYESPTSPTVRRRAIMKPVPSSQRINSRPRQPPLINTGSLPGSDLEFTIPLSSGGVVTTAIAGKFEGVWSNLSSRGSPVASPGQSPRSRPSRSPSSLSLPTSKATNVLAPIQSQSQASSGPPSRPESFTCGCGMMLPLAQREQHELGCMTECDTCKMAILRTKLDWHHRSQCLSTECDYCDEKITLEDREKQHPDCEVSGDDKWKMDAQRDEF